MEPKQVDIRADADTRTVEELVNLVLRGEVRVPRFQRPLRWESKDVVGLFDSVYRGYPIGSLLLSKGPAEAAEVRVGPVTVSAPETQSAFWVVDGQQRLTALTAGLARSAGSVSDTRDPYVLFFDPANQRFEAAPSDGEARPAWVPVSQLFDAAALSEWVHNWSHGKNSKFRTAVFHAGAKIRNYRVPLYIVDSGDQELLKEIFFRINSSGKSLSWTEVHDALFGRAGQHPSTLDELAEELRTLGMGKPETDHLFTCLVAFKGLDPTRTFTVHYQRDPQVFHDAVSDGLPAIRAAMSFLRRECAIPHLRLLPRLLPLVVMVRVFGRFPSLEPRTIELLRRWVWRTLLASETFDERTVLRRGVSALERGDQQSCIQHLLSLVPPRQAGYLLPERFDARAAASRIALVALASLQPLAPSGEPIDVSAQIEAEDIGAFRRIVRGTAGWTRTPANRMLLPGVGLGKTDLFGHQQNERFLESHAVTERAMRFLTAGNDIAFLEERGASIEGKIEELGARLAAWRQSDRPSIDYLLERGAAR